jgi:hypothetical protein
MPSSPMTLRGYYAEFKSISGALAGLLSSLPLLSKLIPSGHLSAYVFPPLGPIELLARIGVVIFALATTYGAFFVRSRTNNDNTKRIVGGFILGFLCFCVYLALSTRFVRVIAIPSTNSSVQVSVGYERTDFAKENFANVSDWEMLRERGTDEEEIWRLWTVRSLLTVRVLLFVTYCLSILALVAAFGWGVLAQSGERPEPRFTAS